MKKIHLNMCNAFKMNRMKARRAVLFAACLFAVTGCKHNTEETAASENVSPGSTTGVVTETSSLTVTKGASVVTGGWADAANTALGTTGMKYPDTSNIIKIDDTTYTTAAAKRKAFTNAIASGSVTSSTVNDTAAIIIVSGTVDLSDGLVTDSDHSYFDAFYDANGNYTGTLLTGGTETKTGGTAYMRVHSDISYGVGSNKTILGINSARVEFGGLTISAEWNVHRTNIIIRNIEFWDDHGSTEYNTDISTYSTSKASADQIGFTCKYNDSREAVWYPQNVWIDHCAFSDGTCSDLSRNYHHDGSVDFKAMKNVTISYCEFYNHDKVSLMSLGDTALLQTDREITYHHNYFHDAIQRMPRAGTSEVHIYNNYYNNIGTTENSGASIGPGLGSYYIVESNYFGKHQSYIGIGTEGVTNGKMYCSGNTPALTKTNFEYFSSYNVDTVPFTIPYSYTAEDSSGLASTIPVQAGPGKSITINGTTYK